MGNIDDAVPFFGTGFNRLYPLIMVIYTILVASNFFDRIIGFFGGWKILKFQSEADDVGGFDPSGMIILHRGNTRQNSMFLNSVLELMLVESDDDHGSCNIVMSMAHAIL